jgi:hypothetical protein
VLETNKGFLFRSLCPKNKHIIETKMGSSLEAYVHGVNKSWKQTWVSSLEAQVHRINKSWKQTWVSSLEAQVHRINNS